MTPHGSRRNALAALALAAAILPVAAALPAGATAGHSTTVSLSAGSGSRQFYVEDLTGHDLTSLAFGNGGTLPFRVRVVDQAYTAATEQFSVSATLNNLYLKSGATHAFTTKVPSSSVSVGFGGAPLTGFGLSFGDIPTYALSGTVPTCASLETSDPVALAGLATDATAAPLCALLGAGGLAVSGVPVAGILRTITPALDLVDVPVQIATGGNAGPFTNADYSAGTIGAGDAAGASGAPAPTARTLMTGLPGLTASLGSQITTQLQSVAGALSLTSPTDDPAGAEATLASVMSALQGSGTPALSQLATDLGALGDPVKQSAVLNHLLATLNAPVASDITSLAGTYASFPVLTAAPASAAPGTYEGTMTVTFVQT